jgi:biopolymer transport protein ExbD
MRFKKVKDEEPRLGITPLIDIVFLLLIFFMVTSHFQVASGVSIKLPKVMQKTFHKDTEKITLIIDKEGSIYLMGKKIDLHKLSIDLKGLVEKDGLVHLLIEADKDVKHGRVVQVMDLAKTAGVRSIIIAANWETRKAF